MKILSAFLLGTKIKKVERSASGNWELYIQLYTNNDDQSHTCMQIVLNDLGEAEFVDLTSQTANFSTAMLYRDSTTDNYYRPRATKASEAYVNGQRRQIMAQGDLLGANGWASFISNQFLPVVCAALNYNTPSATCLPKNYEEIGTVGGYSYSNGAAWTGVGLGLFIKDRTCQQYNGHLYNRNGTYSAIDWVADSENPGQGYFTYKTTFLFEGSIKLIELSSEGCQWHTYDPSNALLNLAFRKPFVVFTQAKKSEYEICMVNYDPMMMGIYRGKNRVPLWNAISTGESFQYYNYGDYARYFFNANTQEQTVELLEDVYDVIICGRESSGQYNCYATHLGSKTKGTTISIDNTTYPHPGWRAIIILKYSSTVLPDELAIMRYYRNANLYGYFFNGRTKTVVNSIQSGEYFYSTGYQLYSQAEFAGTVRREIIGLDVDSVAVADNTLIAGWGFYLVEGYYDPNAWKERYIGTFTYDSSTPTSALQGESRVYKVREMYGPGDNIYGMVECKYKNSGEAGDEYLKIYMNHVIIYTTDLSVIGMRFEHIVNDDVIDTTATWKWKSITSSNGNEYAYLETPALAKSVYMDTGLYTVFDYGDWDNTTSTPVHTIVCDHNDMDNFPLIGIDYLESL